MDLNKSNAISELDGLTGLYQYRAFAERTDFFFETNRGAVGQLHAFYIVDLINFKLLNDLYGHRTGDMILRTAAERLQALFKGSSAWLARFGGTKFMVFLPRAQDMDAVEAKAETLLKTGQDIPVENSGIVSVKTGVGVALSPKHGNSFDDLFTRADRALVFASYFDHKRHVIFDTALDLSRDYPEANFGSFMDPLTENVNYDRFRLLAGDLLRTERSVNHLLCYGDLKRFKHINDQYGFEVGDVVLKKMARILKTDLEEGEFFTRVMGDTFAVFAKCSGTGGLKRKFQNIMRQILDIPELNRSNFIPEIAAGYVIINEKNRDLGINRLIDQTITAQKYAKQQTGSCVIQYGEKFEKALREEQQLEHDLNRAFERGEFQVYFQPQYDLVSQKYVKAEALVRWERPGHGIQGPDWFIPACEKRNIIDRMDFYILDEICADLAERMYSGKPVLPIAVNQSRITLHTPDYLKRLIGIVNYYHIPPALIELEVTESTFIRNSQRTVRILNQLKRSGFSISMDDFGSGYSSLNLLREIPIDVLKLDREFIREGIDSRRTRTIIRCIVDMAAELGITVVCEGVEIREQVDFLKQIGCRIVQGYYFAKPISMADYNLFLQYDDVDCK